MVHSIWGCCDLKRLGTEVVQHSVITYNKLCDIAAFGDNIHFFMYNVAFILGYKLTR